MDTEKYYTTRFSKDDSRSKVWRAINEYLQRFIPNNSTVLDLGCGYGDFIKGIHAAEKYALDLNPNMIEEFKGSEIRFISQSILDEFNIPNNSIDIVFASNLFEHFDDHELSIVMENINMKLKPNGLIILVQPNIFYAYREYWDDYTHKKAFSHVSLSDFLESCDYKTIKIQKKFIPFSLKSRLPKSYFLTKAYLNSPFKPFAKQMLIVAKKMN